MLANLDDQPTVVFEFLHIGNEEPNQAWSSEEVLGRLLRGLTFSSRRVGSHLVESLERKADLEELSSQGPSEELSFLVVSVYIEQVLISNDIFDLTAVDEGLFYVSPQLIKFLLLLTPLASFSASLPLQLLLDDLLLSGVNQTLLALDLAFD